MPTAEGTRAGLSGLDWLVIVAATVALVVLCVWMVQGQPMPGSKSQTPE